MYPLCFIIITQVWLNDVTASNWCLETLVAVAMDQGVSFYYQYSKNILMYIIRILYGLLILLFNG